MEARPLPAVRRRTVSVQAIETHELHGSAGEREAAMVTRAGWNGQLEMTDQREQP
jgi:hypothetical protein